MRWERMFPDELEAAFAACPAAYFTYGLCEPHGPHCALGLDSLKAHAIACRAAHEFGGIVAPPDYWHIHEIGGYGSWAAENVGETPRSWLTAMPPQQHFKNIRYQRLWETVIKPHLPEFETLQLWYNSAPPPENSVWRANWPLL